MLSDGGMRRLTHRAVDAEAALPQGTCSNYFRSRALLLHALAERALERLAPTEDRLAELATLGEGVDASVDYVRYIVERLLGAPEPSRALFELRLEASRDAALAELVGGTLRQAYAQDVAFNEGRALRGGALEIALLHFAIDGLVFDQLTMALDPDLGVDDVVDALVRRILHLPLADGGAP